MIVLGIESTAHTFGVGIVDDEGRILADQRVSLRPKEGGILPREAAELFSKKGAQTLVSALREAELSIDDIDGVPLHWVPDWVPLLGQGRSWPGTWHLGLINRWLE